MRQILIMAVVIALLAANLQGISFAKASDMSDEVIATTLQLTMVYESPGLDSRVKTVLMPVTEVSLVGRSADGKWLALGAGWIQRSGVRTDGDLAALPVTQSAQSLIVITRQMTMVYETPEANSRVETVLMPATEVSLVGRSDNGQWLALGSGWIQTGNIRTNGELAALPVMQMSQSFSGVTVGLTMVYQNPTMSSRVVDVLSPVSIVSLSGRSSDGDWLAVANIRDPGSVKGWVGRGDLQMTGDLAALPVMGMALEALPGLSYAGLGNEN